MSKPKLALIPSGYKSGKVYSILPNDATGDFDFTRQSIGTRVRKDGLIEEAKTEGSITNLILNSEDFSTNWTNFNGASISTDQTLAPDGTNTADKIISNGTNYSFTRPTSNITVTNAKYYTASIYVKADVETVGYIRCDYGTLIYNRKFDLTAGTLSTGFDNTANIPEAERIEELANGWYRISITDVVDTISFEMRIYCADGSASSGDSLFLWGAMVSEGALSDYIKTEGSQVTETVETFTDVPRLDWYNSNCPSLLLESQRTNLLKYSEDLTNAVWVLLSDGTGSNPVVTSNYSIAPNGTLTADRVVFDKGGGTSSTDYSIIRQFVSGTTQRVSSIYMKSNTNENYNIGVDDAGTVDVVTVTPQWQRFEHSGSAKFRLQLSLRQSQTSDFADVSIWGGQLEDGTYPTSYIKTDASTVTRLKDECLNGGDSDLFDITEGTFFVDITPFNNETSNRYISLSDSSSDNRIEFQVRASSNVIDVLCEGNNGGLEVIRTINITFNTRNKLLVTFDNNNFKIYINGSLDFTDTSFTKPINLNRLSFANSTNGFSYEGKVHDTRVYDRVLTEAEAIELTTL